ncbi:hypothetical protein KQI52_05840 [bacterium]|nr:hypothetical protein [bacterium]
MKHAYLSVLLILVFAISGFAEAKVMTSSDEDEPYPVEKKSDEESEFTFLGYYFMKYTRSNIAPTNEFLKGQVVGRLYGGNTTRTSEQTSAYSEQRFMPMITYTPRLFDGWAKMRMSFEFDWTHGDVNYTAGGNFGGAYGADVVNMQTQNLFFELRPQKNLIVNAGLLRFYDNVRVPYYTPVGSLVNKGFRLMLFGSDASGINVHYSPRQNLHTKLGAYQLYENNVEQDDDVQLFEAMAEYDLDVINTIGFGAWYVRDHANGEGGVSILGQGLNSGLSNYNGVFNFDIGNRDYTADIFWLGSSFHGNPLLDQGRWGYNGFAFTTLGQVKVAGASDVDVMGFGGSARVAYKYGRTTNDHIAVDAIFTSGDDDGIDDDTYSGVLTGNNWTSPGALIFGQGLYMLTPHGNVVNRYYAAVVDIQNMGYGMTTTALSAAYDIVPNKLRVKVGGGFGMANADPSYVMADNSVIEGGRMIGTEVNLNLRWTMRVFLDLELHAAYLALGDFYETPATNGWRDSDPVKLADQRPEDPWTVFATLRWIMF